MVFNILGLALNITFGLIPSFLFFVWMEQNCNLEVFSGLFFPQVFVVSNVFLKMAWNVGLVFVFGLIHSLSAQKFFYDFMNEFVAERFLRTVYIVITGISVWTMISFWQSTGIVVWRLPLNAFVNSGLSILIFWAFLVACGFIVKRFGSPLHFVGLRQIFSGKEEVLRSEGSPLLCTDGIFGVVRHPVYFFTLLALVLTPVMSLDRMVLAVAVLIYLYFAIPIEEKKLIAIFGSSYCEYQKKVPAILPRI